MNLKFIPQIEKSLAIDGHLLLTSYVKCDRTDFFIIAFNKWVLNANNQEALDAYKKKSDIPSDVWDDVQTIINNIQMFLDNELKQIGEPSLGDIRNYIGNDRYFVKLSAGLILASNLVRVIFWLNLRG